MEKIKKLVRNLIFFILLIVITFYILLKDQDLSKLSEVLMGARKEYILIAVLSMCFYFICEAVNIGRTLKALKEKSTFFQNLKYALIGFFFSSITPAASGGQPMQIYYMHKENISIANSTLALLMNLMCMQIVTISVALFSISFNYTYMDNGLFLFFTIGILLNLSALALLLIAIFSNKLWRALVNIGVKFLKIFKVKNLEAKKERLEKETEKYRKSAEYIKRNKFIILKILLTAYFQFIVYYSVSYWVYRALGLSGHNMAEITSMQSVVFATVSGIPSPGAVGVSEGAFVSIFRNVFPTAMLSGAMLLNRGVNFYLFVIISGVVVVVNALRGKKVEKNALVSQEGL